MDLIVDFCNSQVKLFKEGIFNVSWISDQLLKEFTLKLQLDEKDEVDKKSIGLYGLEGTLKNE